MCKVRRGHARGSTVGAQRLGKAEKEEGRGKALAKAPLPTEASHFNPCYKKQHAWPPSKTLAYTQICLFPMVLLSIGEYRLAFSY